MRPGESRSCLAEAKRWRNEEYHIDMGMPALYNLVDSPCRAKAIRAFLCQGLEIQPVVREVDDSSLRSKLKLGRCGAQTDVDVSEHASEGAL